MNLMFAILAGLLAAIAGCGTAPRPGVAEPQVLYERNGREHVAAVVVLERDSFSRLERFRGAGLPTGAVLVGPGDRIIPFDSLADPKATRWPGRFVVSHVYSPEGERLGGPGFVNEPTTFATIRDTNVLRVSASDMRRLQKRDGAVP